VKASERGLLRLKLIMVEYLVLFFKQPRAAMTFTAQLTARSALGVNGAAVPNLAIGEILAKLGGEGTF